MKKFFFYITLALSTFTTLSFTTLGNEGNNGVDTSAFIGIWDVTSSEQYHSGTVEKDNVNGYYMEFTATHVTIHNPDDEMNGMSIRYTYDKETKRLTFSGLNIVYNIIEQTSNTMTIKTDPMFEEKIYVILKLRKK